MTFILSAKVFDIVKEIEGVYPEYAKKRLALDNDQDLTSKAKQRQTWALYEEAQGKLEELQQQAAEEIEQARATALEDRDQAQKVADNEEVDLQERAKAQAIREQFETELIAAGPFEFLRQLTREVEGGASGPRLEAARGILPTLQTALHRAFYSRETGNQALDPWGQSIESQVNEESSEMVQASLQQLAGTIANKLKPGNVKDRENAIIKLYMAEIDVSAASRLAQVQVEAMQPEGPQPGGFWDPEKLAME